MNMGIGLKLTLGIRRALYGAWAAVGGALERAVYSLFESGEQGVWYDPSDFERYMREKGPELAVNGSFDTDTDWQKGTGWTIANGKASVVAPGGAVNLTQFTALEAGATYEVVFTVTDFSAGSVLFRINGSTVVDTTPNASANGTFKYHVVAPSEAVSYAFRSVSTGVLSVDNFSIKKLTGLATATLFQDSAGTIPVTAMEQSIGLHLDKRLGLVRGVEKTVNGDFAAGSTGWTVSGADATHIATFADGKLRYQSDTASPVLGITNSGAAPLTTGKRYEVVVEVSSYVSGGLLSDRVQGGPIANKLGTNRSILVGNGNGPFNFYRAGANTDLTIDSISIKEIPGNHRSQPTTASKPKLSARKNLLVASEDFSNAVWAKVGGTVSGTTFSEDGLSAAHGLDYAVTVSAGVVTFSVDLKALGRQWVRIDPYGAASSGTDSVWFDLVNGVKGMQQAGCAGTITALGADIYRVTWTSTVLAGSLSLSIRGSTGDNSTSNYVGLSAAALHVNKAQFECGPTATRYQRVNTATDYDSVGFPHYVKYDGFDDFLVSNAIDFTATDKMTVWAGVRKLSDVARAELVALSSAALSNPGTWVLRAPSDAGAAGNYYAASAGTAAQGLDTEVILAPHTAVLAAEFDISAPRLAVRVNGVQKPSNTLSQGTGNFSSHPLYFGRRAGTSQPFNGHEYQLVIRGAQSTAEQITAGETLSNSKTFEEN